MSKLKIVLVAALVACTFAANAGDYIWTGNGDRVTWTDPNNWQGAGWPDASDAVVEFRSSVEVSVNKGDVINVGAITVNGGGAATTVKLTATEGSSFCLNTRADGLKATGENDQLILETPTTMTPVRHDFNGLGDIRIRAKVQNDFTTDTYAIIFAARNWTIEDGGEIATPNGGLYVVNGLAFQPNTRWITGSGKITGNLLSGCTNPEDPEITIVQDGADSVVTLSSALKIGNRATSCPRHYVLRNGTFTSRALNTDGEADEGFGTFRQEGGVSDITNLQVSRCGEVTLAGGTMTVSGSVSIADSGTFIVEGGTLVVPTTSCGINTAKVVFTGKCTVKLPTHCNWPTAWVLAPGAEVTVESDAGMNLWFGNGRSVPEGLVIGRNVTLDFLGNQALEGSLRIAEGGRFYLENNTSWSGTVVIDGGTLCLTGYKPTGRIVFAGKGKVEISTPTWSKEWMFAKGSDVEIFSRGDVAKTLTLSGDIALPDSLTIAKNVTLEVASGAQLTGWDCEPVGIKVSKGATLKLASQTSIIAQPIDLDVEEGGLLSFGDRVSLVAHSFTVGGVKQSRRFYSKAYPPENFPGVFNSSNLGDARVIVPYVWTGAAGDGKWSTEGNWEDNAVPVSTVDSVETAYVDLSYAGGRTVTFAEDLVVGGLIALPHDATRTVTLAAENGALFKPRPPLSNYACGYFIGRDMTLVIDANYHAYVANCCNFTGGGTLCVTGDFRSSAAATSYMTVDGEVRFTGTTTVAGDLTFRGLAAAPSMGTARFTEGCDVTVSGRINASAPAFISFNRYVQEGGSVTAGSVYMTHGHESAARKDFCYYLKGGTLTLTGGFYLGTYDPAFGMATEEHGATGDLDMSGGTLITPKMTTEVNANWYRLHGGDIYLGAGGFVKSVDTKYKKAWVGNGSVPDIRLGGVTFHSDADAWSIPDTLSVEMTGIDGDTTFDIEKGVTISGPVTGVGGFVKKGTGTLTFAGSYAASGVIAVEAGKVVFVNNPTGSRIRFSVASTENLELAGDLTVAEFLVNGVPQRGSVTVGDHTVTVAAPAGTFVWQGADGGAWGTGANWVGNVPPNALDADVDFIYSDHAAVSSIAIDSAFTVRNLALDSGALTLSGDAAITVADGATLLVEDGATLTVSAPVYLKGKVVKIGGGKVVFTKVLRSETDPVGLTAATAAAFAFRVAEGECAVCGQVSGLRLYADSERIDVDALVTVDAGASLVNNVFVGMAQNGAARAGYGRVVQNGGMVVESALFTPCGFVNSLGGINSYVLNGGNFTGPDASFALNCWNGAGTADAVSQTTITVNGGTMSFPGELSVGATKGSDDRIVVNGGVFERGSVVNSATGGVVAFELNGGTFRALGEDAVTLPSNPTVSMQNMSVVLDGSVVFDVEEAAKAEGIRCSVTGSGCLTKAGLGSLTLYDLGFSGRIVASEGALVVPSRGFPAGTELTVDGGTVQLDYRGAADIDKLTLGNRPCKAGVYDASSRRAVGLLTGTGALNVTIGEMSGIVIIVR